MSSSSAIAPDLGCNPRPRATCNRVRDCPVSTNALVAPSSTYRSVPVAAASSVPYQKITIPINNLTVGIEYVLTFYSATEILLSSGSNSCCNITAYMDNIAISRYCVGYYYTLAYIQNGPYAAATSKLIRSPAIIYRPTVPNPALQFNVVCPVSDTSVTVGAPKLQDVALVPRCTCVEENLLQSLQTQPRNAAFNGNFADYDATQENPVLGWTSQESWRGQVLPVPYSGTSQAVDTSNKGAVVLFGPFASLYRTISGLTPFAPYNVSILSSSPGVKNDCNLTVKFDDKIILAMPFSVIALRAYTHNFTILYPKATAGVLWVGNICKNDFNATRRGNEYNAIRIDDVSFARIGCDDPAQSIASITSMTSVLTVPTGS
ncbi:hypothetical protein HBI73_185040 [Parastagonospora nodorum]|nr:hypothetical protein HBH42_126770 [Parastagonospora nodorum]KAH4930330.1 hypothetical protein HBH74_101510 [Parastagonospora nodorum]KAH4974557.1 hypothetical protein HBH73_052910 [Parastagonospora nodorum]KAH5073273.1 hypothetical protein HBI73_185040 [Parastagonospora nodorum]KAH5325811.1 hypothetical protein HBI12_080120 [Parastagonospora nodorum]